MSIKQHQPQIISQALRKRCQKTVCDNPVENSGGFGIHGDPEPNFGFFEPTNVCNSSTCAVSGIS